MKKLILGVIATLLVANDSFAASGVALQLMGEANQTADTTGAAKITSPRAQRFICSIVATNNSGTTPTLDAKIQFSVDGTHWKDLCTFPQVTTGTDSHEIVHINSATTNVPPRIRAVTDLGGTSPNYAVNVTLCYEIGG